MTNTSPRFRVAISYASKSEAHREFVARVADHLADAVGGPSRVLYDVFHEAEFGRPDLDAHLIPLYRRESELLVVFLDAHYLQSKWCGLEWRVVRGLIKDREPSKVMLIRFDDTDPDDLLGLAGYVDVRGRPADAIAALVLQRLGLPDRAAVASSPRRAELSSGVDAHPGSAARDVPSPAPTGAEAVRRQDVKIGILTALPHECAAMRLMLSDEIDDTAPGEEGGRTYYVGRMPAKGGGVHVVAVALLPDMGNNSAAISATRLLQHFPSARHVIMCGIAGGVPRPGEAEHDVRLGDIVVCDRGGVVQYDLVKERPDGTKEHRHPPRPPSAYLLEAVRHLRVDEELDRRPWEAFLGIGGAMHKRWERPEDHLDARGEAVSYPSDPQREPGKPRVFHGTIAAADTLLKNPAHRDYLGLTFGAKAVEMEGSGLADAAWVGEVGYLVVRGICDYCDQHKGDVWQRPAAIAAAYVRALLGSLPGRVRGDDAGAQAQVPNESNTGRDEGKGGASGNVDNREATVVQQSNVFGGQLTLGPTTIEPPVTVQPEAPRAEKVTPGPPKVAPTRLPSSTTRLFGREREFARLDEAWASQGADKINVVTLVAWGGVGKTSLMVEWMDRLGRNGWRGAQAVFEWSFYNQGVRDKGASSAEAFIAAALRFFGDEAMSESSASASDKGARLAELVGQQRTLLVLDGLEPLQYPPNRGLTQGKLTDPAVEVLLRSLARHNRGLCVVTTREAVADLAANGGVLQWTLDELSLEAADALLVYLLEQEEQGAPLVKSTAKQRTEVWKEVKGHALTLQLLGRYIRRALGDFRRWREVKLHEASHAVQGDHASRMMDAYERWLSGELTAEYKLRGKGLRARVQQWFSKKPPPFDPVAGRRQLAVLRLLGLFDRPADPGCLRALCEGGSIGTLTGPLVGLDADGWRLVVSDLASLGLVTRAPWEPLRIEGFAEAQADLRTAKTTGAPEVTVMPGWSRLSESLDAHPLVREHFGRRLKAASEAAWKEGHRRVFEYLCGSTPYWPEGTHGLGPLYQAVAHGCQAGEVQKACAEVYRDRILRGTSIGGFYSGKRLGAVGADLGAVAWFFEPPWSRPSPSLADGAQAWLLEVAAFNLRALGRLAEAVEPMRAGLERLVEQENWKQAAISAGNLSELELTRGEVTEASRVAEQSVTFADRSADAFWRMVNRTTHADALHQAGRRDDARRRFEEAEAMQAELQPSYPRLYSLRGFQYCDLLLHEAEHAAWRETLARGEGSAMAVVGPSSATALLDGARSSTPNDATAHGRALAACDDVLGRATELFEWHDPGAPLLDIALDHLTLGRASLYQALLAAHTPSPASGPTHPEPRPPASPPDFATAKQHLHAAVEGLRRSGSMNHLPRTLLTRAWLHLLLANPTAATTDLDEAESLATRSGMPIFLADVHLTRARLFRDRAELGKAKKLLEQLRAKGYRRHDEMLADAEMAAKNWPDAM